MNELSLDTLKASISGHRASRFRLLVQRLCAILLIAGGLYPQSSLAQKCLYISSYHQGYAWSDGVERGLRSLLEGKCELKQFDMDTKRNKSPEYKKEKGLEAKQLIESWKPDIVITADDNAAKYIIQPYFKNHDIPFVFCGINWTADEYGFPYDNVTGMVEVAPIYPLLRKVQELIPTAKSAIYIGANTLTEEKNLARFQNATGKMQISLDSALSNTAADWLDAYRRAQQYDFIIIGSNSGIPDWDEAYIVETIKTISKKLSVTNHNWMMPYTMLGFTKVPEEQGEWAAQAALSILDGVDISQIAIVPNRKWDIWTNQSLLKSSNIGLPEGLILKSKQVE
ncbi:MAG: hypothetical protein JSW45_11885 [Thiotrichales bacterium]|nr:MAG: hypothetical protein JSW45_11885 [Thiotrichales bacterium]